MSSAAPTTLPPDQAAREHALDASRSILVQAPAGSGKTDLLTRRFLRLLGEVDEPGQIVAITFTKAAAAEMRHRILEKLVDADERESDEGSTELDEFSMEALARRALDRSRALGWNLIDLPSQLRISTIDSFCRDLALQQPLLSGLGGSLDISQNPKELYRRAARRTLEQIDGEGAELREAIGILLLLRDNGWQETEELLVKMLEQRDKWMHDFVVGPDPDWDALRERLERSFARAVKEQLLELNALLDLVPHARAEVMELARFACENTGGAKHRDLAEMADFPITPFGTHHKLEEAQQACVCLAEFLLTATDRAYRKQVNVTFGFPSERKAEKARFAALVQDLRGVLGLEGALAAVGNLPPLRYSDEDWRVVRASFTLLRHAAAQLKVVFAEAGVVDYVEVAQVAQAVLKGEGGFADDAALAVADGIRHLLVDEFQDTSRRQHQLLRGLIGAWPEREERTCFVVGDPMQSIYSFRDADAELFQRVKDIGLEIPQEQALGFDSVSLTANFRSAPGLVGEFNDAFDKIFEDGSGVEFTHAVAARRVDSGLHLVVNEEPRFSLHLEFLPPAKRGVSSAEAEEQKKSRERAVTAQIDEIVALVSGHQGRMEAARGEGSKYRIAILGRTKTVLTPVAQALREAAIPFRAIELETLKERQEILDALALARALLNSQDRVAWLGVLRAPWCGLSLADLHALTSADDKELIARTVPELLTERLSLLSNEGRLAAQRVLLALELTSSLRFSQPAVSLGTWLEQVWLRLGGADCVDANGRANIDLLWQCLDSLPEGEQDLLGRTLDAALEKLTGLPDPNADEECGVQLMTIHKAKGLEFEVVIVPDLQAVTGGGNKELLSWLERGLAEPDDSGEVTEFLVAPLQAKGADRSGTRKWVDDVRRQREKQEDRRILYVAATRAREELHLFARPDCNERDGVWTLKKPEKGLLAAAWPALEEEAQRQFEEWRAAQESAEQGSLESLAASSSESETPAAMKPTVLRRLPPECELMPRMAGVQPVESIVGSGAAELYERHAGGLQSRALGTAVHGLLQELAWLRQTLDWEESIAGLSRLQPRMVTQIRAAGIDPAQAGRIAAQALEIAINAARDPLGQWILSPHAEAASEARWAGVVEGALRTVQMDRVFKAGIAPQSEGNDAWWIVDYKSAHLDGPDVDMGLAELRETFAPQVEAYARVLRNLHGKQARIFGGLFYPRMMKFDWWKI
jgi:ATP-dependent helicase/nuclease subunit A